MSDTEKLAQVRAQRDRLNQQVARHQGELAEASVEIERLLVWQSNTGPFLEAAQTLMRTWESPLSPEQLAFADLYRLVK